MTLRPLIAIVCKDLVVFLTDRRALILSFAAPLVLASFFAVVFGGGAGSVSSGPVTVTVSIADLDGSDISRALIASTSVDGALRIELCDAEAARSAVAKGHSVIGVIIPQSFGRLVSLAPFAPVERPELTILHDSAHGIEAAMVRGLLGHHVRRAISRDVSIPFEIREETITSHDSPPQSVTNAHVFGGMAVQFILFGSIEAGVGLLTERQKGIWRRLRAAPVAKSTLLLGRLVSSTILSLSMLGMIFGFGAIVFDIRVQGSFPGFLLVALAYATTAASFGLLIAAMGKTPQAARGLSVLAVLVLVMLGGAWVPTFVFPVWLQYLTTVIPTRWAVDGFAATLSRGLSLGETMPYVYALTAFTTVFSGVACLWFRWDED